MTTEGKMSASKLTRLVQRFMKCADERQFSRKEGENFLIQQLFVLRSEDEQSKDIEALIGYIASFGPRKVCQYQVNISFGIYIIANRYLIRYRFSKLNFKLFNSSGPTTLFGYVKSVRG